MSSETPLKNTLPDDDKPISIPQELTEDSLEEPREEFLLQKITELSLYVEQYSGPIPHPRVIAGYEQIVPGSGDRILSMSEQQHQHRMNLETRAQRASILREMLGLVLGFVVAAIIVVGGLQAVQLGSSAEGLLAVFGSVAAIAGVFVYSHRSRLNELRAKREALEKPSAPKLP